VPPVDVVPPATVPPVEVEPPALVPPALLPPVDVVPAFAVVPALDEVVPALPLEPPLLSSLLLQPARPTVVEAPVTTRTWKSLLICMRESLHGLRPRASRIEQKKTQLAR
jgi:hypothetical protein